MKCIKDLTFPEPQILKPEEIPMFKGTRDALDDISIREEDKGVDFIRALKVDANGTSLEIKSYLESLKDQVISLIV